MKKIVKTPCPFCGGNKVSITAEESYENAKSGCICISCLMCSTDVWYMGKDASEPYEEAVKKAVDKWETRIKAWDIP